MAYFRLSLLESGKVTELEVQSSSFIQLTFIHDLFLSFIRIRHLRDEPMNIPRTVKII